MRWNSSTTMSVMLGSIRSGSAKRPQNWAATVARRKRWGRSAELGAEQPHDVVEVAPDECDGGTEKRERANALGVAQADLDGDPAAHRVADEVSALDAELVHHRDHRLGEPAGVVGGVGGLRRGAEAGEVEGVDAVVAAQGARGVEEGGLGPAEPVEEQDVRPAAHRQGRDSSARQGYLVHAQQRLAAVRETEEALEADGEVEVATGVELALPERLDPRQRALAQPQPGGRVGADRHVGLGAGDAPARPRSVPVQADLQVCPRSPRQTWMVAWKSGSAPRYRSGSVENASSTSASRRALGGGPFLGSPDTSLLTLHALPGAP